MTTEKVIPEDHKFAAVYVGAPYGLNDGGQLEFTTETEKGAEQWIKIHFGSSPKGFDMRVIDLDFAGYERYAPMTPRTYFMI